MHRYIYVASYMHHLLHNTKLIVCIDIDECNDVDTICPMTDNRECRNTNGSYRCDCIPGYVESVPNGICRGNYINCSYIYLVYSNRTQAKNKLQFYFHTIFW